jgi:hypothetical protein
MKQYILAAIIAASTFAANAQTKVERADSVTTILTPGTVTIKETPNSITVKVRDVNDSTLVYSYKNKYSENATIVTEERGGNDFGLKIPFIGNRNKVMSNSEFKSNKTSHWDVVCDGLGFGATWTAATPEVMDGHRSVGCEFIFADILAVRYTPWRYGWSFQLGFGINFRNDYLKGNLGFTRADDRESVTCTTYPDNAENRSSRIYQFDLLVPFNVKYNIHGTKWGLGAGVWGNFCTHASITSSYKLDGVNYSESWSGINKRVFRLSYVAKVNYDQIGLYVKYTPKNVIENGYGPQYKELSAGLMLLF